MVDMTKVEEGGMKWEGGGYMVNGKISTKMKDGDDEVPILSHFSEIYNLCIVFTDNNYLPIGFSQMPTPGWVLS